MAVLSLAVVLDAQPAEQPFRSDGAFTSAIGHDVAFSALTFIHDIQGSGASSPLVGNADVTVEGIVVGDFQCHQQLNGFFLQEEWDQVDDSRRTSEGMFVYDAGFGVDVRVGDLVRVTGSIAEYYSKTEITDVTAVINFGLTMSLAATSVTLPLPNDADWEWYEGMLVTFPQPLTVTDIYNWIQYGEVELSVNGRLMTPTQIVHPGSQAQERQALNDRCRIQLDDGSTMPFPQPIPYILPENSLRVGSSTTSLTGVIDYNFGAYELNPTTAVVLMDDNSRLDSPAKVLGSLQVASFNVLNYFNGDGMGGGFTASRGAATLAEFQRQRTKLVSAIVALKAHIVSVIEIENDGFDFNSAIQDLTAALNAATTPGTFAFIDPGLSRIGSDEITCGILYRPDSVTPHGRTAILDHSIDPNFTSLNRPSIAQTFRTTTGQLFTLAVNHFKSKSSACDDDPDIGDGQGNCNQIRRAAAQALVDWLATDPTNSDDPDFLIIGDLNAYAMEDPITVIRNAGYLDQVARYVGEEAYSYVFKSQSGYLDHALASAALSRQITGTTVWHINADEARQFDYHSSNPAGLFVPNYWRSSDHDPIIIGLELKAPFTVQLAAFTAEFRDRQVYLNWRTASELNVAGFNLYRAQNAAEDEFRQINSVLLPAKGDSLQGAEYHYEDSAGNPEDYYRLQAVALDGSVQSFPIIGVTIDTDLSIPSLPIELMLYDNFPNPFNLQTLIRYDLPIPGEISLLVYDLQGKPVRILKNGYHPAGSFHVVWDSCDEFGALLPSGLYLCRLRYGSEQRTRAMVLLK